MDEIEKETLYPPVGIAHVLNDVVDLCTPFEKEFSTLEINFSCQPNGPPHLGTVTTLLLAFALAAHFKDHFAKPAEVSFDMLENSPDWDDFVIKDGISYCRSIGYKGIDQVTSKAETNMVTFRRLLDMAAKISGVQYRIRTYQEFQSLRSVRKSLRRMIELGDSFAKILNPKKGTLHVRTPCPECGYTDKYGKATELRQCSHGIQISSKCFLHGIHTATLSDDSMDFIDTNAALRDVLKGVIYSDALREQSVLAIMCDGMDWGGTWSLSVFGQALTKYGEPFAGAPVRIFAPMILDWSGAKFSKSLYIKKGSYEYLPEGFSNFESFMEAFGHDGFLILWNEISSWALNPKKLFRNYSIEYIIRLLGAAK